MFTSILILQLDYSNHRHLEAILTITKSPGTLVLERSVISITKQPLEIIVCSLELLIMIWCGPMNQRSRTSWMTFESVFIFDVVVGKINEIPLVTIARNNTTNLVPSDKWIGRISKESPWCVQSVVVVVAEVVGRDPVASCPF